MDQHPQAEARATEDRENDGTVNSRSVAGELAAVLQGCWPESETLEQVLAS